MRPALVALAILASCTLPIDRALQPGELRGRVAYRATGDGSEQPAANALVRLVGSSRAARTDAQGRFVLRGVPAGRHTVRVDHTVDGQEFGFVRPDVEIESRSGTAGGRDLGKVVLNALASVSGMVRRSGAPVANARVVAQGWAVAETGDDGTYALFLPHGTFDLAAVYPDGEELRAASRLALAVRGTATLDFEVTGLEPIFATVTGSAFKEQATTHEGITIELTSSAGAVAAAVTDADGSFAFPTVPVGVFSLVARADGFSQRVIGPVAVFPEASLGELLLASASGADCDGDGTPDKADADDDKDGTPDAEEAPACACEAAGTMDANEDGICDALAPPPAPVDPHPLPVVSHVSPVGLLAGMEGAELVVTGSGFVKGSVVRWNGASRSTIYVTSTELHATLDATALAVAGTATLDVVSPPPGGGTSNAVELTILAPNPLPTLARVLPLSLVFGREGATLLLTGTGFIAASVVEWNGSPRPTTWKTDNALEAALTAEDLATPGEFLVRVTNPAPGGGASAPVPVQVVRDAPAPGLVDVTPRTLVMGMFSATLTITGTDFAANSFAEWNETALTTTVVSTTQLTAEVPADLLASPGEALVRVVTPPPGGGVSTDVTVMITAGYPLPSIDAVTPDASLAGSSALDVTVSGAGFVATSEVRAGLTPLATTFRSPTELVAHIPDTLLAAPAALQLQVVTPAPGGGGSNPVTFTIYAPAAPPTVSRVLPSPLHAGSPGATLQLEGTGFLAASVVEWNGAPRPTTFVSDTRLDATLATQDLAIPGEFMIRVTNPPQSGGSSADFPVQVEAAAPAPVLVDVTPRTLPMGMQAAMLTIDGADFVASSVVEWNQAALVTTVVSASRLTAEVPAIHLMSPAEAQVRVVTPPPGGGVSATVSVTIAPANPVPSIESLTPGFAPTTSSALDLTVVGTGFVATSAVRAGLTPLATTFLSPTELVARIPDTLLAAPGALQIQVVTPAPGGGGSNTRTFTVTAPASPPTVSRVLPSPLPAGSPGATLQLDGTGFVATSVVEWNGGPRPTTFVSETRLDATLTPGDLAMAGDFPVRVTNPPESGGSSATFPVRVEATSPAPLLVDVTPRTIPVGAPTTTLTVTGSDFTATSFVEWNGTALTVTSRTPTQLLAEVPAFLLANAGQGNVRVVTPPPGGGASANIQVNVTATQNPLPTIASLSPDTALAMSSALDVTVQGTGFVATSEVRAGLTPLVTTYRSPTELVGRIPDTLLVAPGALQIQVVSPAPGGGGSNTRTFTIGAPAGPAASIRFDASISSTMQAGNQHAQVYDLDETGRNVHFIASATNLVPNDTNGFDDVFVHDSCEGATGCTPSTERLVVAVGALPNQGVDTFALSRTGRYLAFASFGAYATGGVDGTAAIYWHDTCRGATGCTSSTRLVSKDASGGQSSVWVTRAPAISADGRFVAFESAHTMTADDAGNDLDVFLHDTCVGATGCTPGTVRVSMPSGVSEPGSDCMQPSVSDDGRFVAFICNGALEASDTNAGADAYVRDTCFGATGCTPSTTLVSVAPDGARRGDVSPWSPVRLSGDGRRVMFNATNAFAGLSGTGYHGFVRTTCLGATGCTPWTELIAADGAGAAVADIDHGNDMTPDGRYVTFTSAATALGADGSTTQAFLRDTCFGATGCSPSTRPLSRNASGAFANAYVLDPQLSRHGRLFCLLTEATNFGTPQHPPGVLALLCGNTGVP